MNIIRISTRIYPDKGGPAKQAFLLSQYCAEKGINIINIASHPKSIKKSNKSEVNKNFHINYLPFHAPSDNSNLLIKTFFFLKFFIYSIVKLVKIRKKQNIDLIHAHSPIPSGFIAFLFSKLFNIPYIFTMHGLDYPNSLFLNLEINFTLKNSKRTIVVSNTIFDYLENRYNLKNLIWIPNGIEISQYYHVKDKNQKVLLIKQLNLDHILSQEDLIISYIGYMFFYQKVMGMIDFIEAFSNFLKTLPSDQDKQKIKLLFIGDGPYSYLLKEAINKTKFQNNIFFLGKKKVIADLLAISDLLALTSYIEGNPNVILESMASKVPCIGSDVGDIKYMIDDTGFIVNPGNIQQIKEAIQKYYNLSSHLKQELGEKAFNRVKNHFNIEKIIEELITIYNI